MEEITIVVTKKVPYTGNAERPPAGDLYEGELKYTCWDSDDFKDINVGDTIKFSYTSKDNEYNGRTYANRNISKIIVDTEDDKVDDTPSVSGHTDSQDRPSMPDVEELKPHPISSVSHIYRLGDLEYEVIVRLLP